jgi:hypothetical protein
MSGGISSNASLYRGTRSKEFRADIRFSSLPQPPIELAQHFSV